MPDIEAIIKDLTSQELVLDQWRTALQEAAQACAEHNSEYHHLTDPEKIAKWKYIAANLPEGVAIFSPDQVRKVLKAHGVQNA